MRTSMAAESPRVTPSVRRLLPFPRRVASTPMLLDLLEGEAFCLRHEEVAEQEAGDADTGIERERRRSAEVRHQAREGKRRNNLRHPIRDNDQAHGDAAHPLRIDF